MEKATPGCRCSHARETLHAVCPKLLKFLLVLRSAYQRRWCSSARNKMILRSMQRIILGSKACLLHDCPWKGCPWETQSYPNHAKLDTVFSANVLHSMQRIILASKACLLHECPLLASEELFLQNNMKKNAKLYTVVSVDSAAWGFFPAGSGVLSTDVLSTDVLSTAGPWNMPPCSRQ